MFVAAVESSSLSAFITDGINWTESVKINLTQCNSVCYGDGVFVAVGQSHIEYATKTNYSYEISDILNLEDRLTALESLDTFYPVGSVYTSIDP